MPPPSTGLPDSMTFSSSRAEAFFGRWSSLLAGNVEPSDIDTPVVSPPPSLVDEDFSEVLFEDTESAEVEESSRPPPPFVLAPAPPENVGEEEGEEEEENTERIHFPAPLPLLALLALLPLLLLLLPPRPPLACTPQALRFDTCAQPVDGVASASPVVRVCCATDRRSQCAGMPI